MTKYRNTHIAILSALALLATACGDKTTTDNAAQPEATKPIAADVNVVKDPVTLNFFYNGFSESLTNEVKRMIETKFPTVTINMMLYTAQNTTNDVVAAGTPIDIAAFTAGQLFNVMDLRLTSDLTGLMEKYKFDTSRLADGVLETVKGYSDKGEIPVMPYELNNSVLLYNKTIFDKFGVPYPKDGMTWDDVLELTKRVSRVDNGVEYRAFSYTGANPVYKNQLGLPFVDPQTNKATMNTEPWKRWLQVMTSFYTVEANKLAGIADNIFFKDQTMAMRTGPNPLDLLSTAIKSGLEWDAVSMPVFKESPGSQMNAPFYIIPPNSRDKDTAFKVINYLMSDEVQSWAAKQGRVPIVKSKAVVEQFGADVPFIKGTNYAKAVFEEKIAKPILVTKYDGIVRTQMTSALAKVATTPGLDLNTALREAEEAANKAIQEAQK